MPDPSLIQEARNAATHFGIPPDLFVAQIQQESSFNPNATNGGAKGIAQFMDATAAQYGVTNPYDPTQALWGAAAYDADLYHQTGSYSQMLQRYGTIDPGGPSNQGQSNLLQMASSLDGGGGTGGFQTVSGNAGVTPTSGILGNMSSGIGAFVTNFFIRIALVLVGIILVWQGLAMMRGSSVKENIEVVVAGAKRKTENS